MLGQDAQGPTAVLKSVSKLDNTLLSNGTLLNVKFTPATLEGEAGLRKLADFLRAFTQLKLQHIQFNVVNADTLREAQQRPQDYAGWWCALPDTAPSLSNCRRRSRMTSSAGQRISCNVVETRRDDVARIFNIQRYSLNDGEGIRTVVFLKAVRIFARGVLIRSRSPAKSRRYAERRNVCTVRNVCVMRMNAPPVRLNGLVAISALTLWNGK
ncbi:formate acetyltransferase 2 [Escherichia coli]|uniref:Formate acetyltransferase 2 n=1 Tax=Escherichia coli TaxID=562 RepID=A0A376TZE7_ECOLX|nr:formate acetyltransferase 2 [Escherichia coli]